MKKIVVVKWEVKAGKDKEGKDIMEAQSTLTAISNVLNRVWANLPNGIDNFRAFKRIASAIDEAEKTGNLLLEERDYLTLCGIIEKNIPGALGMVKEFATAIEDFLDTKKTEE